MSLFRRQRNGGSKRAPTTPRSEPQVTAPAAATGQPAPAATASRSEPAAPRLVAPSGGREVNALRAKVQTEVCAIMSRLILEQIRSGGARSPVEDEILRRQAVNRLYADVLYGLMSGGAAPDIDPSNRVQRWARGALEDWGQSQTALTPEMVREREALVQSILDALATAGRDETLRKAAVQRLGTDREQTSKT